MKVHSLCEQCHRKLFIKNLQILKSSQGNMNNLVSQHNCSFKKLKT